MDYTERAYEIVKSCWNAMLESENLRAEVSKELQAGHITDGYAGSLNADAEKSAERCRQTARMQLDQLSDEFAAAAIAFDAPDGKVLMTNPDYRLLADNYPMSQEELIALCERNKQISTVTRKAQEYGAKHDMLPYVKKYYHAANERIEAFKTLIGHAKDMLLAASTSPARSQMYWNSWADRARDLATL